MSSPVYGERSPDGFYWWDGTTWQAVTADAGQQGDGQPGGAAATPTPAAESGDAHSQLLAKVNDPSELDGHFTNAMDAAEGQAQELSA